MTASGWAAAPIDRLLSLAEVMPHLGYLGATAGGGTMPRHYYLDLATWHRINALYTARTLADLKALRLAAAEPERIGRLMRVVEGRHGHALAMRVEEAKIALSDQGAAWLNLSDLTGGPNPATARGVRGGGGPRRRSTGSPGSCSAPSSGAGGRGAGADRHRLPDRRVQPAAGAAAVSAVLPGWRWPPATCWLGSALASRLRRGGGSGNAGDWGAPW